MVRENINNFALILMEICESESFFYADLLRTHLKTHSDKSQINATSVTLHSLYEAI